MSNSVYKVGDCFRNKQTGHLIEITKVYHENDGIHNYYVKKLNIGRNYEFTVNYSVLLEYYEKSALAQVLYSSNSIKAVTNG